MLRAFPELLALVKCATTSACCSTRTALSVISSGSPGPTPRRRAFRARSYAVPRKRVDGGRRHRASTHSPQHGEKWNTARVRRQRVLRLRGADEANGDTDNRGRPRRTGVEHFE